MYHSQRMQLVTYRTVEFLNFDKVVYIDIILNVVRFRINGWF